MSICSQVFLKRVGVGVRRRSVVDCPLVVRLLVGSNSPGGPIELFLIPVKYCLKQIKVRKESYLIKQDTTIYKVSIKLSFSGRGRDESNLQKEKSNVHILITTAA